VLTVLHRWARQRNQCEASPPLRLESAISPQIRTNQAGWAGSIRVRDLTNHTTWYFRIILIYRYLMELYREILNNFVHRAVYKAKLKPQYAESEEEEK